MIMEVLVQLLPIILIFALVWFLILDHNKSKETSRIIKPLRSRSKVTSIGGIKVQLEQLTNQSLLLL